MNQRAYLLFLVFFVFTSCARHGALTFAETREARAAYRLLESVRRPVSHRPRPFSRPALPDPTEAG